MSLLQLLLFLSSSYFVYSAPVLHEQRYVVIFSRNSSARIALHSRCMIVHGSTYKRRANFPSSSNYSLDYRRPVWETFLGIDWDGVLSSDCTDSQRAIIDDAVWNAYNEVLWKTMVTGSSKVDLNPSWNRFFMNDNEADRGYGWTTRGDVSTSQLLWLTVCVLDCRVSNSP
jgi:hypothetical protein